MNAIRSRGSLAAMLGHEALNETRRVLRDPAYTAPSIGFPLAFYLLFVFVLPIGGGDPAAARALFLNYVSFGVIGAMLFGTALPLAQDRDHGVLKLKRTTPQPFAIYVAGKLVAALLLATVVFAVMAAVAVTAAGLVLPASRWALLAAAEFGLALGSGALGLAIGAWFRGNAAPGIVNLWFLPTAALGGLWFPLARMPDWVQALALLLPSFHGGELARAAAGVRAQSPWLSLAGTAAWTLIGLALAAWGLRRRPF